ncbi:MAG: hypothetical protein HC840_21885 [Leptolyngbyaceae cyanobacterium RM2_2_4]|nr:hypothetical protein [Leptolyngbyaceae cyanobacterium RM2_2_4]NJO66348.1 hypothetical protein [Leptolyngbyaceae cyanobacterium RM1_405_57]
MPHSNQEWRSHWLSSLVFAGVWAVSIELSGTGCPIQLSFAERAIAQTPPDTSTKAELPEAHPPSIQAADQPESWLPSLDCKFNQVGCVKQSRNAPEASEGCVTPH